MQEKLMKLNDYSDGSNHWRIACDCLDSNHDCDLWFSPHEQLESVGLNLSMEVGIYPRYNWLENIWKRIAIATKVLFTGYYTATGEVILDDKGIAAMQTALTEGVAHVEKSKVAQAAARVARLEKLANKSV
jgi:hypothetical protein